MTLNEHNKLETRTVCLGEEAVFVSQGKGKREVNLPHKTKGSTFLQGAF